MKKIRKPHETGSFLHVLEQQLIYAPILQGGLHLLAAMIPDNTHRLA